MEFQKYLGNIIDIINRQKTLFIISAIIIIMLGGIISMSIVGSSSTRVPNPANINNSPLSITPKPSQQTPPSTTSQTPPSADAPWTTKFIYFIGNLFTPGKKNSASQTTGQASPYYPGNQTQTQNTTTQQTQTPNSQSQSQTTGGSSGSSGGSSSPSTGQSSGQSLNPNIPTPTPVTNINIVFQDENGQYWTYTPPAAPPIDVQWVKYTNYQDHYSIEYPSDWIIIKSNYNGHEGITLYQPGDPGNIDKPSIAFVGWKADYLTSSASYTGQITLNNIPGTIYTNGPIGPSSVAAVFQYQYGYFALGSSTTNDVFIYIFDHMLRSLNLNE